MSVKRNIHINQIQVRFRGVTAETARGATIGIGQEVMNQISQKEIGQRSGGSALDKIPMPVVRVANGIQANEIRRMLSEEIASAIERSLADTKSR